MDELIGDPRKLPLMRKALADAIAHYDAYCVESVAVPPGAESQPRVTTSEARVSAA